MKKEEESKASEIVEKKPPIPADLSPRSKRQMMWDFEDSYSDSQASAAKASKEDDQDKVSNCDSDSMPESTLLCLICNKSFDSPEASQAHVLRTLHESFEMIDLDTYAEEMKESLFSFERDPESDEWLTILKREFRIIF